MIRRPSLGFFLANKDNSLSMHMPNRITTYHDTIQRLSYPMCCLMYQTTLVSTKCWNIKFMLVTGSWKFKQFIPCIQQFIPWMPRSIGWRHVLAFIHGPAQNNYVVSCGMCCPKLLYLFYDNLKLLQPHVGIMRLQVYARKHADIFTRAPPNDLTCPWHKYSCRSLTCFCAAPNLAGKAWSIVTVWPGSLGRCCIQSCTLKSDWQKCPGPLLMIDVILVRQWSHYILSSWAIVSAWIQSGFWKMYLGDWCEEMPH